MWNQYMVEKRKAIGLVQSLIDECVFYHDDIILIVYIKNRMFFSNSNDTPTHIIQQMKDKGLNIEDQGHRADYVGVNIKKLRDGTYEFTQNALIDSIIDDINIRNSYTKPVPMKAHFNYMHLRIQQDLKGTSITTQS